jgi:DNA-binding NarL/FixJ family response regulator
MREIGVLLVEDHPGFTQIVKRFLQQDGQGIVLRTTISAKNLVPMIEQIQPQVVLLDLERSDPSVLETIALLRAHMPCVGIIGLTLFDAVGYREATLAAGADDFLIKDALGAQLLATIHRVVEKTAS